MSKNSSEPKFEIIGYTIQGFGNFYDSQEVIFPEKMGDVLILGRNGSGKTTSLLALNSAFGGPPPLDRILKIAEDEKGDKMKSLEGKIDIFLQADGHSYTLSHRLHPSGAVRSSLVIKREEEEEEIFSGRPLEVLKKLNELTKVKNPEWFKNSVLFLTRVEESLKRFKESIEENSVIPTLNKLRNVFENMQKTEGITLNNLKREVDKLEKEQQSLSDLSQKISKANLEFDEIESRLETLVEKKKMIEARIDNLKKAQFDIDILTSKTVQLEQIVKEKEKRLYDITERLENKTLIHEEEQKRLEELSKQEKEILKELKNLRVKGKIPDKLEELKVELKDFEHRKKEAEFKYKHYQDEVSNLIQEHYKKKKHSNMSKIKKDIETLENSEKKITELISNNEKAIKNDEMLLSAVKFVKDVMNDKTIEHCPICGSFQDHAALFTKMEKLEAERASSISSTQEKIKQWRIDLKKTRNEIKTLERILSYINEAEKEKQLLDKIQNEISKLTKKIEKYEEKREKLLKLEKIRDKKEEIEKRALEADLEKLKDGKSTLESEMVKLNEELLTLKKELQEREGTFDQKELWGLNDELQTTEKEISDFRRKKDELIAQQAKLNAQIPQLQKEIHRMADMKEEYEQGLKKYYVITEFVKWCIRLLPKLQELMKNKISKSLPEIVKKYGIDVISWDIETNSLLKRVKTQTGQEVFSLQMLESLSSGEGFGAILGTLGSLGLFDGKTIFIEAEHLDDKSIQYCREILHKSGATRTIFFKEHSDYEKLTPISM